MKKITKKLLAFSFVFMFLFLACAPTNVEAKTVKLNKKSVTLTVGKTFKLKVKNTSETITWKSKDKKVATVNKNGKITAKKKGSTYIIAKVGNKKLKCKVTVKAKSSSKKSGSSSSSSSSGSSSSSSSKVWIPSTGSKYHSSSSCSNMKNPKQVSLSEAEAAGYEPCKKCY